MEWLKEKKEKKKDIFCISDVCWQVVSWCKSTLLHSSQQTSGDLYQIGSLPFNFSPPMEGLLYMEVFRFQKGRDNFNQNVPY